LYFAFFLLATNDYSLTTNSIGQLANWQIGKLVNQY